MKYIKLYFNDWAMNTRVLTLEEKGAWVDLIAILSSSEKPGEITLCARSLGRLWGVTPRKASTFLESISGAGLITFENNSEKFRINCSEIEKANSKYSEFVLSRKSSVNRSSSTKASSIMKSSCKHNEIIMKSSCEHNAPNIIVNSSTTTTNKNSSSSRGAKGNSKATSKSKPPTLEEVLSFCASRNIPSSTGEAFFNYYEGHNLWLNKNKEPIKWWFVIQNEPWKSNHEHNSNRNGSLRPISRNTGTANETDGSEYAEVGRVVRN